MTINTNTGSVGSNNPIIGTSSAPVSPDAPAVKPIDTASQANPAESTFFTNAGFPQLPAPKPGVDPKDYTFYDEVVVDGQLAAEIEANLGEELGHLVTNKKITEREKNQALALYKLGLEGELPDALKNQLEGALDKALAKVRQKFPQTPTPYPRKIEENREDFSALRTSYLEEILANAGYTEQDGSFSAEGLTIKHIILSGSAIPPGSPASKILGELNAALQVHLSVDLDFKIDDNAASQYLAKIGSEFEDLVLAKAPQGQEGRFEYLLNHPDESDPLQALVNQARSDAMKELQTKYGFPINFTPAETSLLYDAKLNGTYYSTFSRELGKNALTDADQAAVIAYAKALASGTAANFPYSQFQTTLSETQIASIATEIHEAAMNAVKTRFDIGSKWQPDPTRSLSDYVGGPGLSVVNQLQDLYDALVTRVDSDPSISPADKLTLKNFLKMISQALADFQELMYMMQIRESEGARDGSKVMLSLVNEKIEKMRSVIEQRVETRAQIAEQNRKAEEARKKDQKKKQIMMYVAPALLVVTLVSLLAAPFSLGASLAIATISIGMFLATFPPIYGKDAQGNYKATGLEQGQKALSDLIAYGPSVQKEIAAARSQALKEGKTEFEAEAAANEVRKKYPIDKSQETAIQAAIVSVMVAIIIVSILFANPALANVATMILVTLLASSGITEKLIAKAIPPEVNKKHPWIATVMTILFYVLIIAIGKGGRWGLDKAKGAAPAPAATATGTTVTQNASAASKIAEALKNLRANDALQKGATVTNILAQTAATIPQIIRGVEMSKSMKELADIADRIAGMIEKQGLSESEQEMLQGIIDLFKKFVDMLTNNTGDFTQLIAGIQESMKKTYEVKEATTTLYNSA